MKQFLIALLTGLLLASPLTLSVSAANPSTLNDRKVKKTATVTFKVSMHCQKCVAKITDNISFLRGVEDLKVSLDEKTVTITYKPSKTNEDTLRKELEKLGYTVEKVTQS